MEAKVPVPLFITRPLSNHSFQHLIIYCLKHLKDQTFKAIILYLVIDIYWGKPFQIVVLFSRIIVPDNAVVAEQKLAKLYFLHNLEGNHPQNTSVSEPWRSWPLSFQTRSNTILNTIYCQISSWYGHCRCIDLKINYAKFAPLNVWNFALLHVFIMLH